MAKKKRVVPEGSRKGMGGQPRRFKSPKAMKKELKRYMKYIKKTGEPFLLIGFADFCDVHRTILDGYADKPEYSDVIRKIKQKSELNLVTGGLTGRYNAPVSIFLAKNNHGYTDKTESVTDNTHHIQVERTTLKGKDE